MMAMWSDMLIASSWSCVTYSTVMPRRCWISLISTCISKRRFLSSAPSGSSLPTPGGGEKEQERERPAAPHRAQQGGEPPQLKRPGDPLADRVFRPAPSAQWKGNVLEDIQVGKDRI